MLFSEVTPWSKGLEEMDYVFVLCCIVFVCHEDETEHSVHYNHLNFHKPKSTWGYSLYICLSFVSLCFIKGFDHVFLIFDISAGSFIVMFIDVSGLISV